MEALFPIQGHPTIEAFEEYAFKRLSEPDIEALEEHVLVCPECQTSLAEVDEYILLMKQATARNEPRPASVRQEVGMGARIAVALLRKGPKSTVTC